MNAAGSGAGGGSSHRRFIKLRWTTYQTAGRASRKRVHTRWVPVGSSAAKRLKGRGAKIVARRGGPPPSYGAGGHSMSPDAADANADAQHGNHANRHPVQHWIRQAKKGNKHATRLLQKFLRHQGYRITVDGLWGPQTAAAAHAFNHGNPEGHTGQQGDAPNRDPVTHFNNGPHANKPGGKKKARQRQRKRNVQLANTVTKQLGKGNVGKKLNVKKYARTQAGAQFDSAIHDLKALIERAGPDNAQAMQDIANWYGQVNTLNDRAGDRAGDIAQGVANRQDAAVQQMLSAIGGSANAAAPMVAAQNLQNTGLERALGGIEQQYHADMDPVIALQTAEAKRVQQAQNLKNLQDMQLQLADLLGQRGQAAAAARQEAIQFNDQLAQQRFQNRLARLQAIQAAQMGGLDLKYKRAQLHAAQNQAHGNGAHWHDPAYRSGAIREALATVMRQNGQQLPKKVLVHNVMRYLNNSGMPKKIRPQMRHMVSAAVRRFYSH